MGEQQQGTLFRPEFNRSVRVEASEAALSEDAGALVLRQVSATLGLDNAVAEHLSDRRSAPHVKHSLRSLVRTAVLLMAQGWVDQDDADALRDDVVLRIAVADCGGAKAANRPLASQPTLSRMVGMLADGSRDGLHELARETAFADILRLYGRRREATIDIDSYADSAHGHQEGAVYNGHYHETCLHPLIAFADTGHVLDGIMRAGNAHTAAGVRAFAEPIIAGARQVADIVWLRFDAGFVAPAFMDWLDDERVRYIARMRTNAVLKREAEAWATRTRAAWTAEPSEQPREATFEFWYQAEKWRRQRRIVAVMVERLAGSGELFDEVFFLVTNAARPEATSAALLERYRKRGRAENHIGEFVNTIGPKISSSLLRDNEVVLLLGMIAYNLVHHVRTRLARHLREGVSLQRVRERFLKAASHAVRHARRVVVRIGRQKVHAWRALVAALELTPAAVAMEAAAAN